MNIIKHLITCAGLLLILIFHSALANTYIVNSVPNPYQQSDVIYVVDPDHILASDDTRIINQRLRTLEQYTTIETVVVALPSIGQMDTREFANKLFNHWQIGKKDKDNGLLILLVIDQREVVFEVGYGLEGNLTDAKSYRLMEQYMLPRFKQNQFSQGMVVGVDGVAKYLEQQFADGTLYAIGKNPSSFNPSFYLVIAIIILIAIYCFWEDRIFLIKNWYNAQYRTPLQRLFLLFFLLSLILLFLYVCVLLGGLLAIFIVGLDKMLIISDFTVNSFPLFIGDIIFLFLLMVFDNTFSIIKYNKQLSPDEKLICSACRRRSIIEITQNREVLLSNDEKHLLTVGATKYRLFRCQRPKCQRIFKGQHINEGWKICNNCQQPTSKLIEFATTTQSTETESGQITKRYICIKCLIESEEKITTPSNQQRRYNGGRSSGGGGRSGGGSRSGGFRGGGRSGGGGARGRF